MLQLPRSTVKLLYELCHFRQTDPVPAITELIKEAWERECLDSYRDVVVGLEGQDAPTDHDWIPIADQMPDPDTNVLVYCNNGDIQVAHFSITGQYWLASTATATYHIIVSRP